MTRGKNIIAGTSPYEGSVRGSKVCMLAPGAMLLIVKRALGASTFQDLGMQTADTIICRSSRRALSTLAQACMLTKSRICRYFLAFNYYEALLNYYAEPYAVSPGDAMSVFC